MERRLLMVPKEVMPETNEMNIKRNDISFILACLIKEVFFAALKGYFHIFLPSLSNESKIEQNLK